jgi:hypothetical protein
VALALPHMTHVEPLPSVHRGKQVVAAALIDLPGLGRLSWGAAREQDRDSWGKFYGIIYVVIMLVSPRIWDKTPSSLLI